MIKNKKRPPPPGIVFVCAPASRHADPGEIDPDPDPTFKQNRIRVRSTKKNRIQISRKSESGSDDRLQTLVTESKSQKNIRIRKPG